MQLICPVCNGMLLLEARCASCGHNMTDLGPCKDYFGPYSPYEEISGVSLEARLQVNGDNCCHLQECPNCLNRGCTLVDRVTI